MHSTACNHKIWSDRVIVLKSNMQAKSNKLAEEASTEDRTSGEHRENRGDKDSWATPPPPTTTTTENNQNKWEEPERNNLFYLPGKHHLNYRPAELTRISKQESGKQDKLLLLSSLCGGQQHSA
ncbi:unnamed protein product [Trichobilharzia szidati]|nr:unnamed protein product [Trichobilharzia szidati]